MLFPTIDFAIFFLIVFPTTWALNGRNTAKKWFLLGASYVFYSCWDWRFVGLLFVSSVFNFFAGLLIAARGSERARTLSCAAAVALNLLPLLFFKYFDFLMAEVQAVADHAGLELTAPSTGLGVPVAISFLTFHAISYVVDVRRGDARASRSLLDLLLYISFFPHLVAGPIVRAADFLQQLARPGNPDGVEVGRSLLLIIGGLFKKVVISSQLAVLFVDPVFTNPVGFSRIDLILAVYAYAVVIYCDFSAYTDIAIGVANLLGYRFPQNFDQPYRATSLREFWRRWHITLSRWLRDYLYVPLGGNRGSALRTYRNLMITMGLGGLWHGAGLQFVFWGLLHGAGLAVERLLANTVGRNAAVAAFLQGNAGRALAWFATFNFVCVGWVYFRCADFATATDYLGLIVTGTGREAVSISPYTMLLILLGLLTQAVPPDFKPWLEGCFEKATLPLQAGFATACLWATVMLSPNGIAPFIYFQF